MKYMIETTPAEIARSQQALCQLLDSLPLETDAFHDIQDLKTLIGVLARLRLECDGNNNLSSRPPEFALTISV